MVILRNMIESDLPIFFAHQNDELAIRTSPSKPLYLRVRWQVRFCALRWKGKRKSATGSAGIFWGKGIATKALKQFLGMIAARPLNAHVAKQNIGSRQVLEKCGFVIVGEEKWTPPTGTEEVDEYALRLE